MSFVCFIRAEEYSQVELFLLDCLRRLSGNSRLRANEGVLVPLQCKMRANILKRGLFCIINDCVADPGAAILAFACASEIDCTVPECLGLFLYEFAEATIVLVPE